MFSASRIATRSRALRLPRQCIRQQSTKAGPNPPLPTGQYAAPVLDVSNGTPFTHTPPSTPAEVTERLTEGAWSITGPTVDGVVTYDGVQVASNFPCEDALIHGKFPSPLQPSNDWMGWGVFDGHLGSLTSQALTKHLLPYVHTHLSKLETPAPDDATIHRAIKAAFLDLDDQFTGHAQEIIDDASLTFAGKVNALSPGTNGSCALLSMFDPATRKLHVACTGDSRAVLGRKVGGGGDGVEAAWEIVPLSVDQGGSNEAEAQRVRDEHKGEKNVVKDGRVLGLATARAFGDGHWKWPATLQAFMRYRFNTNTMRVHSPDVYKTPPYITAEPEVTTTELKKGQPAFMIMASDGLWDRMTSEQAVDLVAKWIDWHAAGKPATGPAAVPADGMPYLVGWTMEQAKGIAVQDDNAAVHLTRNALGGTNQELVSATLAFKPPFSRKARDDITVQVVFFN
ncbi:phosphatase 2C-like domain-containing protein [Bombardia bombarda]|uniref:Phosphatase 2C-like domain-containing protein n=1 Tax=Bombardia bombarda TaxID=252184 RepID=A0AA40CG56_9PEZI|nr:phosphatase 2C-like domain-containing protein [Bombardia bombarda]